MTAETTRRLLIDMTRTDTPSHDSPELVLLLGAQDEVIGTVPKATVHTTDTPLHLAFSVHLRSRDGRVLLTRRSLAKVTWPGVWTNAFCGHPAPEESFPDAIARRSRAELRLDPALVSPPRLVLPHFRYRAVDASGIVENEVCPVYVADYAGDPGHLPRPDPGEVADAAWCGVEELARTARDLPFLLSPWLLDQLAHPELVEQLRAG